MLTLNRLFIRKTLTSLLVGAAVLRISVDFLPDSMLWLTVLLSVGAGVLAWDHVRPRWHVWPLLLYLAVPFPMQSIALLGVVSFVTGIRLPKRRFPAVFVPLLAGAATFFLYMLTLSPGMLAADAGEFQVVAATWGVAHPPGYALYTLVAGGFAHLLPMESVAWRVNLFSAVTGGLTAGVVAWMVYRENRDLWLAWGAAFALATATTIWMTATQASIRPLTVLFAALMLEAVLAYRLARRDDRAGLAVLVRFGLAAGFGVAHHGSIFFVGCVFALWIVLADLKNWHRWWIAPVVALAGLLPIAYLPLRADGFLAPAGLDTLDGLLNHVLARGFSGDVFAFAAPEFWRERWLVLIEILRLQWHILVLSVAGFAWLVAALRDRWLGSLLLVGAAVHLFVSVTYRSPQTVEYALPAYLLIAVTLGMARFERRLFMSVYAIVIIAAVAFGFRDGWLTMRRLASVEEARTEAQRLLYDGDSPILAQWHRVTPLWYLQQAENVTPDTPVNYVITNQAPTPMDAWVSAIESAVSAISNAVSAIESALSDADSVRVTQHFPERYRFLPYTVTNGTIYATLPENTGQGRAIGSHRMDLADIASSVEAGEQARVRLRWEISEAVAYGELTTFVHIGLPDAPPVAQLDVPMQVHEPGMVEVDYAVYLPYTVPPGRYDVFVGAYTSTEVLTNSDDEERTVIGEVTLAAAAFPLPTQHPISIQMDGLRLLGWDYDTSMPESPRLYLHWRIDDADKAYDINVGDKNGGFETATRLNPAERAGHWTSVHALPDFVRNIRLNVNDETLNLRLPDNAMYIILGDVGAVVGWDVSQEGDDLHVTVEWLGAGATFSEMTASLGVSTDERDFIQNWTSVYGAMPTLKWRYGHVIRDTQRIPLHDGETVQEVRLSLFDAFTGQVVAPVGREGGSVVVFP